MCCLAVNPYRSCSACAQTAWLHTICSTVPKLSTNAADTSCCSQGMLDALRKVVAAEGIAGLWRGSLPAVSAQHHVPTPCILHHHDSAFLCGNRILMPFPIQLAASSTGACAASPLAIRIRTRPATLPQRHPRRCSGPALAHLAPRAVRLATRTCTCPAPRAPPHPCKTTCGHTQVQRAALVNLGELTTYDVAKRRILELGVVQDGPAAHAMSSGCSGFVAALVSTPAVSAGVNGAASALVPMPLFLRLRLRTMPWSCITAGFDIGCGRPLDDPQKAAAPALPGRPEDTDHGAGPGPRAAALLGHARLPVENSAGGGAHGALQGVLAYVGTACALAACVLGVI